MKSPFWLQKMLKSYVWRVEETEKSIYLTFDDGPTPEITDWVLDFLGKENILATFFLIGDKIVKFPATFNTLISSNHKMGNHTFNHLVGWRTSNSEYLENVELCQKYIHSNLFRPPHGRIKPSQAKALKKKGYNIIMWDILSGDFDQSLDTDFLLSHLKSNTRKGSIVVFHDSEKAWEHLKIILPPYIIWLKSQGYNFKTL